MLKQPFFTTELMSRLVREFKVTMESTFTSWFVDKQPLHWPWQWSRRSFRNTITALGDLQEHHHSAGGHEGEALPIGCRHCHQSLSCQSKTYYCPSRSPKLCPSGVHGIVQLPWLLRVRLV
jgi:hypothetical protein